jgi:predicted nuclease of restriction endonuclease-like RecB superfamily
MTQKKPKYRSKFEGSVAALLPKTVKYEAETYDYVLELRYTPDWRVSHKGKSFLLEAKGKFDYEQRRKILAVLRYNAGLDLRIIFMRNNRISKKSKTTYTDWCFAHGIKCSVYPELPF